MAPAIGAMPYSSGEHEFPAKLTGQVVLCSIIAAFGGLMFGYDIGAIGDDELLFSSSFIYM